MVRRGNASILGAVLLLVTAGLSLGLIGVLMVGSIDQGQSTTTTSPSQTTAQQTTATSSTSMTTTAITSCQPGNDVCEQQQAELVAKLCAAYQAQFGVSYCHGFSFLLNVSFGQPNYFWVILIVSVLLFFISVIMLIGMLKRRRHR